MPTQAEIEAAVKVFERFAMASDMPSWSLIKDDEISDAMRAALEAAERVRHGEIEIVPVTGTLIMGGK